MTAPDGATDLEARLRGADWARATSDLDMAGGALIPDLLTPARCRALAGLYDDAWRFRATVDMARHRFGAGEYRYFAYPLPEPVQRLRAALYPLLLPIARRWAGRLGRPAPWPDTAQEWLDQCHRAGQTRPTPLLLRYGPGDWNALHQDLYGDLVFPLQVVVGLDVPGADYTGGEFLLVEQRARAQSRGTSMTLPQGHGLVFATRDRPTRSARGWSVSAMRHGVSTLHTGHRHTLGLVFHDAA